MRTAALWMLALAAPLVHAQTTLRVGDHVRVRVEEQTRTGVVVETRSDTLVVAGRRGEAGAPVAYGPDARVEVWVRRSRGTGALRGALVGAGVAGAASLAWAATTAGPESMGPGFALVIGGGIITPAAAVLGAAVGALVPGRRWRRAERGAVAVQPGAVGAGPGLTLSLRL